MSDHEGDNTTLLNDDRDYNPLQSPPQEQGSNSKNVVMLGVGFLCLFIGFNTLQNFEGTLNHSLGIWSLSTIYLAFSLSGFVSSFVIQKLSEKITLPFGAVCYVLYMVANLYPQFYTLIPTAALLGFGAAVLWASQGSYLSKNSSKDSLGFHSGLFWALFIFNSFVGNLAAGFFVNYGSDNNTWLIIFFIVFGVIGTTVFVFLPSVPRSGNIAQAPSITETFFLIFEPKMLLITSTLIYSGLSQSYFYSVMPGLMGKKWIGFVMATFGLADTVSSIVLGKCSDLFGRVMTLAVSSVFAILGFVLTFWVTSDRVWLFFIIMPLFGVSDGGFSAVILGIIGIFQPKKLESGYAYLNLIRATSTGIAFAYSQYLPLDAITGIALFWIVLSIVTFTICDKFVQKVDQEKE